MTLYKLNKYLKSRTILRFKIYIDIDIYVCQKINIQSNVYLTVNIRKKIVEHALYMSIYILIKINLIS